MLKQQLQEDMKAAMKQSNSEVLGVLRLVLASINTKEKEKRYKVSKEKPSATEEDLIKEATLNDEEITGVITSEVKKRRDAITLYEQGGRQELADAEKKEITVLQKYLPEQLSESELVALIEASIKKTGASSIKDMGKIMADLMPQVKGKADNSKISNIIKEKFSN